MVFAAPFSATDAWGMCTEHVLGLVLYGILIRPDVELFGEHNEE